MSHYKTKATALRHIESGDCFFNAPFKQFWNDKEVFFAGTTSKNEYVGILGDSRLCDGSFSNWINEWRWDGAFVKDLFDAMLKIYGQYHCPRDWILPYLPEEVTSNPAYLYQIGMLDPYGHSKYYEYLTGEAKTIYDNATRFNPADGEVNSLAQDVVCLIQDRMKSNPGLTIKLISKYPFLVPRELIEDREFCRLLSAKHGGWFGPVMEQYRDDIDFVIDAMNDGAKIPAKTLSYNLRKIIRENNPLSALSAHRLQESLASTLTIAQEKATTQRIKI